ncbi:hypothetical protein RFI_33547, partial [Reticulomyxa filosa]
VGMSIDPSFDPELTKAFLHLKHESIDANTIIGGTNKLHDSNDNEKDDQNTPLDESECSHYQPDDNGQSFPSKTRNFDKDSGQEFDIDNLLGARKGGKKGGKGKL